MVAKVSGGSWELLGWSLSGGRPPIIEGQRRFRKVTHAWMKGSWMKDRRPRQAASRQTRRLGEQQTLEYIRRAPLSCQLAIYQV